MSRMNSFVAGLGLAALLSTSAAFAGDAESCKTVRLSDVGWTDIQATTGLASVLLTALGYEPKVIQLSVPVTMKKRLSSILRSMVIGGLVATGVARVLILLTASPVPDPASGRTEPSLFAPIISSNWDYITPVQAWLLIVLLAVTLVCVVGWPIAAWMERRADAGANRRIFGRQGR